VRMRVVNAEEFEPPLAEFHAMVAAGERKKKNALRGPKRKLDFRLTISNVKL
jgi:hypothetical protein